ncbi:tyrosine-type recombinase/integrase [Actinopolymorpha singaporensis]
MFLRAASAHRLSAFFHLAAYTGARRGELLNLRWSDVDLDGSEIRIRGSAAVIAGERVEGTTKGGRERLVSIDARTVRVLREHRSRQAQEQLVAGAAWASDGHVFTTGLGLPVYPDTVSQLMPKLISAHNKSAGIQPPLPRTRRSTRPIRCPRDDLVLAEALANRPPDGNGCQMTKAPAQALCLVRGLLSRCHHVRARRDSNPQPSDP